MKTTRLTPQRPTRVRRAAFTLLEVLLVLGIIVVIAALVVPQLMGRGQEANVRAAQASCNGFLNSVKLYAEACNHNEWPKGDFDSVVQKMMNPPPLDNGKPREPFIDKIPRDPWGSKLVYKYEQGMRKPQVYSIGPDKNDENGGGDDVLPEKAEDGNNNL